MLDLTGRPLCHKGIVLVNCRGLEFGIIENIYEGDGAYQDYIMLDIVEQDGTIRSEVTVHGSENIFNVAHRQLPEAIRAQLIRMSGVRR